MTRNLKPETGGQRDSDRTGADGHFPMPSELSFLASDYITSVELSIAMARHKNGEIEVVPVILYPMDLKATASFFPSSVHCPNGTSPGRISQRTATGTMRFLFIGNGIEQAIDKARLRWAALTSR